MFGNGANSITIEDLENFLNDDGALSPEANSNDNNNEGSPAAQSNEGNPQVNETKAFANRLKEATTKARSEERESIAKSLGYESYADMQKKREAQMLEDKGLDPDDVSPVVEQLVQKRLAEDPRLQELENYRQERMNAWAKQELATLSELTGGRISKMEDVPKDVIEAWKTKGSLKAAYLELHGEKLIREMQSGVASAQTRTSTSHMASVSGNSSGTGAAKRPLTQKEREIYKFFNPSVTEEQLSKMYKED